MNDLLSCLFLYHLKRCGIILLFLFYFYDILKIGARRRVKSEDQWIVRVTVCARAFGFAWLMVAIFDCLSLWLIFDQHFIFHENSLIIVWLALILGLVCTRRNQTVFSCVECWFETKSQERKKRERERKIQACGAFFSVVVIVLCAVDVNVPNLNRFVWMDDIEWNSIGYTFLWWISYGWYVYVCFDASLFYFILFSFVLYLGL